MIKVIGISFRKGSKIYDFKVGENQVKKGDFVIVETTEGTEAGRVKYINKEINDKKIIFRLARFVPHKGTSWFIGNVMPKFTEDVIMVAAGGRVGKNTAGDKDDFAVCEKIIKEKNLGSRVWLFPNIPEEQKKVLLCAADIVV